MSLIKTSQKNNNEKKTKKDNNNKYNDYTLNGNFSTSHEHVDFLTYLISSRTWSSFLKVVKPVDPFYELKNGLNSHPKQNRYLNLDEALSDLEPLTKITELKVLRIISVGRLVLYSRN